jgi:hypothetical protein
MKGFAIKIRHDGKIDVVEFTKKQNNLKFLQDAVDGLIECVTVRIGNAIVDMWVNEEGLLSSLPINKLATQIHELRVGNEHACIVGNVILTGGCDPRGYTMPLTLRETADILQWIMEADGRNFENQHFILEA